MRIVSWNVNGLRARIKYGFEEAINELNPDILCIQETRARPDQLPRSFLGGYNAFYSIHDRPGYAGATTFVRKTVDQPLLAIDDYPGGDERGRVSILDFKRFKLINSYSPNSGQRLEKLERRIEWQAGLANYIGGLPKPCILCGDLNVAPTLLDNNTNSRAGTSNAERTAFQDILGLGYSDVFRTLNPKEVQYTWFSNQYKGREVGKGMRLDHFVASNELLPAVKSMYHVYDDKLICSSDHVPIVLDIEI